jgi:hypothetical protein
MRVVLHKTPTTPKERTIARAMQADLQLPDDAVPAEWMLQTPAASNVANASNDPNVESAVAAVA